MDQADAGGRHLSQSGAQRDVRTGLNWPQDSLDVIEQYKGVPIRVVGYLVAIQSQRGSGESVKRHWTRAAETDWHIAIVEQEGQGEQDAIVVETTPRIRVNHPKWTVGRIDDWLDSADPVRISGWLMFDRSRRKHLGRYRGTLWEPSHEDRGVARWGVGGRGRPSVNSAQRALRRSGTKSSREQVGSATRAVVSPSDPGSE